MIKTIRPKLRVIANFGFLEFCMLFPNGCRNTKLSKVITYVSNQISTKVHLFRVVYNNVIDEGGRIVSNACWFINGRNEITAFESHQEIVTIPGGLKF